MTAGLFPHAAHPGSGVASRLGMGEKVASIGAASAAGGDAACLLPLTGGVGGIVVSLLGRAHSFLAGEGGGSSHPFRIGLSRVDI